MAFFGGAPVLFRASRDSLKAGNPPAPLDKLQQYFLPRGASRQLLQYLHARMDTTDLYAPHHPAALREHRPHRALISQQQHQGRPNALSSGLRFGSVPLVPGQEPFKGPDVHKGLELFGGQRIPIYEAKESIDDLFWPQSTLEVGSRGGRCHARAPEQQPQEAQQQTEKPRREHDSLPVRAPVRSNER